MKRIHFILLGLGFLAIPLIGHSEMRYDSHAGIGQIKFAPASCHEACYIRAYVCMGDGLKAKEVNSESPTILDVNKFKEARTDCGVHAKECITNCGGDTEATNTPLKPVSQTPFE